ncbi:MAG: Ig-like domain-containing protein [Treponema sp.]|nr:Ig-like domain-containing protein [Treponema sp.]
MRKTGKALAGGLALLVAFTIFGCGGDSSPTALPPEGLSISVDGTGVANGQTVQAAVGQDVTATATLAHRRDAVIGWAVADDNPADITPVTGSGDSFTFTAASSGTSRINVTALNSAGSVNLHFYIEIPTVGLEGIVILHDGEPPADGEITWPLETNGTLQLGYRLTPLGATGIVTWSVDDESIATVNPNTGIVTPVVTEGPATVTVTARVDGYDGDGEAVYFEDSVDIEFTGQLFQRPEPEANVIFEWIREIDGPPQGTLPPPMGPFQTVNAILRGAGSHPLSGAMPLRSTNGHANFEIVDEGIRVDGRTSTAAGILAIGTNSNEGTTASTAPDGVFDFSGLRSVRVITYVDWLTPAQGERLVALWLSRTLAPGEASPFGPQTTGNNGVNVGRVFYWRNEAGNTDGAGVPHMGNITNGTWDPDNGAIVSRIFGNYLPDPHDFLDRAFVSVLAQGLAGGNAGAEFVIRGIRIEYVDPSDEPVWDDIEIYSVIGETETQVTGTTIDLEPGTSDALQLSSRIVPATSPGLVLWTSSNPSVASIGGSSGMITTGTERGTATITATVMETMRPGQTTVAATVHINTGEAVELTAIHIYRNEDRVTTIQHDLAGGVGPGIHLNAVEYPEGAPLGTVVWSSGNMNVATVGENTGLVTVVGTAGTAVITATAGTISATVTINVTGQLPDPGDVDPNLVFEWMYPRDNVSGTFVRPSPTAGTENLLQGRGSQPNMPVAIGTGAGDSTATFVASQGLRLAPTTVNASLQIGLPSLAVTADRRHANSSGTSAPDGVLDFSGPDDFEVTIYATFVNNATVAGRGMFVGLSNNTVTASNSPFGPGDPDHRLFFSGAGTNIAGAGDWSPTIGTWTWTTNATGRTGTIGHATGRIRAMTDPNDFMNRTFIGIVSQNNGGPDITITGIRIMRIPADNGNGNGDTRPPVGPNVIFEWMYEHDGAPVGNFVPAAVTATTGAHLAGVGSHPRHRDMPIRIVGAGSDITYVPEQGIRINAMEANAILTIGTDGGAATTADSAPEGFFDFTGDRNVRVTFYTEFRTPAIGNRSFSVWLSHNTTAGAASPFGSGNGNVGRIFFWQDNAGGPTAPPAGTAGANGIWDAEAGTVRSARSINTITPTDELRRTFVSIISLGSTGAANSGAESIITGIRIEYVD